MKKILLVLALAISTTVLFAQEDTNFNKWSVELGAGLSKPSRPFTPGYFSDNTNALHGSLGIRYMFNEKYGVRTSFGLNDIQADDRSRNFEAQYYRATVEGVINLGNVLEFHEWSNSLGLLFHAGAGVSYLDVRSLVDNNLEDTMKHVMIGVTPQIKISERLTFFVDFSLIGNAGMDTTWDGKNDAPNSGFDGSIYNYTAGININLGKNDTHADWFIQENALLSEIELLENRLAKLETDLIDSDQDGVADYLDRESNTMSGVAVDTKGIAVDKNKNGIPDEIESSLDARYLNKNDYKPSTTSVVSGGNAIKDLLNNGYVNVYFQFNSTKPEAYSLEAINYIKVYLMENPQASAQLIGYADELGNASYNAQLSEKRAKKVYDILVASGIAANRLSHTGNGEDSSVNKNSSEARQLVRRVTFKLN